MNTSFARRKAISSNLARVSPVFKAELTRMDVETGVETQWLSCVALLAKVVSGCSVVSRYREHANMLEMVHFF